MKDSSIENEVFQDEIDANSIVVTKEKGKKSGIIFVVLGFLLLLFLGIYLLFRFGVISFSSKQYISGNLFVVHSKTNFGDTISSFESYNSYDNAYSYTFYIKNDNKDEYLYKVKLRNLSYEKGNSSSVMYAIVKDSAVLFKGKLDNNSNVILTTQSILPSRTDSYEIKLWSDEKNEKLKFKIDVES